MHEDRAYIVTLASGRIRWVLDAAGDTVWMDPVDMNKDTATADQLKWMRVWADAAARAAKMVSLHYSNGGGS